MKRVSGTHVDNVGQNLLLHAVRMEPSNVAGSR